MTSQRKSALPLERKGHRKSLLSTLLDLIGDQVRGLNDPRILSYMAGFVGSSFMHLIKYQELLMDELGIDCRLVDPEKIAGFSQGLLSDNRRDELPPPPVSKNSS